MVWISVGVNIAFAIGAIIMGIIMSVRKMLRKRRTIVVHFGTGGHISKISQKEAEKLGFVGPEPPLYPESKYPPQEEWPKPNYTPYDGPGTRSWADRQGGAVTPNVLRREMGLPELPEN